MNKIERQLLKTAKKIVLNFAETELSKQKTAIEKKQDESFLFDVMNSGILIDVNKLKLIGIDHLQRALKERRLKWPE